MPFKVVMGNITNYEGDAILNSLGPNGRVYGNLCKAIIEAADDENIKNFVDAIENADATSIYLTEAGKLPCKNIIHVVTPYKRNDADNKLLAMCYQKAINLAIEKGFKSICLPLIGSKASGYSSKESYEVLNEVCREIVLQEEQEDREIINITFLKYLSEKNYFDRINKLERQIYNQRFQEANVPCGIEKFVYKEKHYCNESISNDGNITYEEAQPKKEKKKIIYDLMKPFLNVDSEKIVSLSFKTFMNNYNYDPKYPFYFLLYLMNKRGISEKILAPNLSNDNKKNFKKTLQLQNKDIIMLANDAGLSKEDIVSLLIYNGSSLSPRSMIDRAIAEYLNNYDKISNHDIVDYVETRTGIDLTYDSLAPIDKELNYAWYTKEQRAELLYVKERERYNTRYI